MNKIGVLTFQNAYNYGAVLQAYALRKVIGKNCDIINYGNEYFKQNEIYYKYERDLKRNLIKLLYKNKLKQKIDKFHVFQKYLVENRPLITDEELKALNDQYDMIITGSDQVWNLKCSGNKTSYFLDFIIDSYKKNSYAASFGSDNLDDINMKISKKYLSDFNNISVRENSGKKIIKELTGRDVPVVLDPTMLLSNNEWDELIEQFNLKKTESKKYVLLYSVLNGDKIIEYAKDIAQKMGLDLYFITSSLKPHFGIKCIRNAGPIEWLNYVKNAEVIVTNSYHGLAFSLIYNKPFFIELLPPPNQTNARILELLSEIKLSDRIINNNVHDSDIDYNEINKIINKKRQVSLEFLYNNIINRTNA